MIRQKNKGRRAADTEKIKDTEKRKLPSKKIVLKQIMKLSKKGQLWKKRVTHIKKVNSYAIALGKVLQKKELMLILNYLIVLLCFTT